MAIQWFPGHMHLTRQAIAERITDIDVVIELLDARLPGSSRNPMLAELIGIKPTLKVLGKQDLADAQRTESWLAHYNAQPATRAIALDAGETAPARRLIAGCRELAPGRVGLAKPMRVLICGIPNVGKSTLINTLVGKRAAKTGDEAGITRMEQRIVLADDFYLWDTPGVLWPRIRLEESGVRLAASGAIGRNAYDEQEVALDLLAYLIASYPQALVARYKVSLTEGVRDEQVLEEIARRRAAFAGRGRPDLHKAAEIVLHEFRAGTLGRITLETPAEFAEWDARAQVRDAQRQARKEAQAARGKKVPRAPRDA